MGFLVSLLCGFVISRGHSFVPAKYVTEDGQKLRNWVANQRALKTKFVERKLKLENPFWVGMGCNLCTLGTRRTANRIFGARRMFTPANFVTEDGYRLGSWVQSQRYQREKLTPYQKERLESLGGWVWDAIAKSGKSVSDICVTSPSARGKTAKFLRNNCLLKAIELANGCRIKKPMGLCHSRAKKSPTLTT